MASDSVELPIEFDDAATYRSVRFQTILALARINRDELATRVGVEPRTIYDWLHGTPPYARNIEAIEAATRFSAAYILSPMRPPTVAGLNYFVRAKTPSYVRARFSAYATIIGELLRVISTDVALPPVRLDYLPTDESEADGRTAEAMAQEFRARHMLSDSALDPVSFAEALGVIVAYGPADVFSVDGYSAWIDGRPTIVLNPNRSEFFRLRFTVAHEVGHLVMHSQHDRIAAADEGRWREDQADRFARALLLATSTPFLARLQRAVRTQSFEPMLAIRDSWGIGVRDAFSVAKESNWRPLATSTLGPQSSTSSGPPSKRTERLAFVRVSQPLSPTGSIFWRSCEPAPFKGSRTK